MARLESDLTKIAGESGAAAKRALLQTGADIAGLTKQLTPVDTGHLKHSYGAVPVSSNEVHVGTDTEYAGFVEFGTVHSPAQPHLTPAFLQSTETFKRRLADEMNKLGK